MKGNHVGARKVSAGLFSCCSQENGKDIARSRQNPLATILLAIAVWVLSVFPVSAQPWTASNSSDATIAVVLGGTPIPLPDHTAGDIVANGSSTHFTVSEAGQYAIGYQINLASPLVQLQSFVSRNGTIIPSLTDGGSESQDVFSSGATVDLGAGDTISLQLGNILAAATLDSARGTQLTLECLSCVSTAAVTSVAPPANGTYAIDDTLAFTANFNQSVTVTGSPELPITIGNSDKPARFVSGSGTSTLTFQYAIAEGDQDADGIAVGASIIANGGAIRSTGGQDADLTLNAVGSTGGVLVDGVRPIVVSGTIEGSPAPDANRVRFVLTFSEPVILPEPSDLEVTTTGSATGEINLIARSNEKIFVDLHNIAGAGSLRLDVPSGGTITDFAGNPMEIAFVSGVPWIRSGANDADLTSLVPNVGTLDPAFDPGTSGYTVAVDNATDSVTLMPIAADSNATITVDGQPVVSGVASPPLALAVGATPIDVVVTAEDGTTVLTYTVTVERARPVPTVVSRTIEVDPGQAMTVDLTEGASGGPFTDATIIDLPPTEAGTARIEHTGQLYRLVFTPNPAFAGTADVRFTLSNAMGPSAPGTISFIVRARPDPSLDPEVLGFIGAQTQTARRFADTQITNFSQRLEQLHSEDARRSNAIGFDISIQQPASSSYTSGPEVGQEPALGAIDTAAPNREHLHPESVPVEALFGDLAFWSGGFVNFGTNDNGTINLDHTLVGVSGGFDYRFSPELTAGFGIGYGRDVTAIGVNGTESRAEAVSIATYGSYRPGPGMFIDGLAGFSAMRFDAMRHVTATGDIARSVRSGDQIFGAISAGYEHRDEGLLVSSYGRLSGSRSTLEAFAETGAPIWNLVFGEQTVDTLSATLGLRVAYDIPTEWGVFTPRGRIEYTHDFIGSSPVSLGYADPGLLSYDLDMGETSRDDIAINLGLDVQFGDAIALGLDYRTSVGISGQRQEHTFAARLGIGF